MTRHILHAAVLALALATGPALAQADHSAHGHAAATAATTQELTEGVLTRWDARTGKATIRHGEIRNLDMPPMTMVFTLKDPAQVGALQPGDAVRFRADEINGVLVITHIEAGR
jgi:Cu/Ag efflux protein CusF